MLSSANRSNGEADDAQAHFAQIQEPCGFHPGRTRFKIPINVFDGGVS